MRRPEAGEQSGQESLSSPVAESDVPTVDMRRPGVAEQSDGESAQQIGSAPGGVEGDRAVTDAGDQRQSLPDAVARRDALADRMRELADSIPAVAGRLGPDALLPRNLMATLREVSQLAMVGDDVARMREFIDAAMAFLPAEAAVLLADPLASPVVIAESAPQSPAWPRIGIPRVHDPVTPEFRSRLPQLAADIATAAAERARIDSAIADLARSMGIDPDGLGTREIAEAVDARVRAADAAVAELMDRPDDPARIMTQRDDLAAALRDADELRSVAAEIRAELERLRVASAEERAAVQRAGEQAARDVLVGLNARIDPEGVGHLPGGRRILVASPSPSPDDLLSPQELQRLADAGVRVDYVHVEVDETGTVTTTPIRPPATGTPETPDSVPPGNDPSGGSTPDFAEPEPEPHRPKHRGLPADESQQPAQDYEPKHRAPQSAVPESEGAQPRTPDPREGAGRHRGEPADESQTEEQPYEPRHRASQPGVAESEGAQLGTPGTSDGTGRHRGEPADESQPQEQTYEPRHRASQPDSAESEGAEPGMPDPRDGVGKHRGEPADESGPQEQTYEPRHRASQPGVAESEGAQPGTPDPGEGAGRHRGEPADESGGQPDYQPRHRRDPAEASQQQAEGESAHPGTSVPESQQPGEPPKAEEPGEQPDAEQPGEQPQAQQGEQSQAGQPDEQAQPEQQGAQSPVGEPEADPLPPEAQEALDRLRAERADAVARRAEWDDIRRMRAEALDPADASTIDALARAAQQFDDADAAVAELDAEIAELELANTPEGVYRQLMRERAVLAREREFWRAKRDDRYSRFSDLPLPFGDAAQALNQSNLARTLEHLEASVAGTRSIAGTGDEAGYVAREQLDPGEIARRREQIFKLHDAALRYNRVQAALAEVDRRIAALGRVGIGGPQPLSQQVRAEVDRLAEERAREVLESKPWRQMRADIAARLRVNEADLGPNAVAQQKSPKEALEEALAEVAGRTIRADQMDERRRNIELLREAATHVNEADNRIARIQGWIAELAGAGRDFLAAEGARQVTDRVGFVDGDPQRIIVIAPRGTLAAPRAEHDAALLDATHRDSRVARAMLSRETTIEYRELVAELDQPVTTRRLRSPSREFMTLGPEDAPVLRRVRWQSGTPDSPTWHEVNPERPAWTTNRKGPTTPKEFKERDLPEGVSGWAANPFQAAVVDPFVDNGPGVNKGLLPAIPGGDPIYPGQTYELPFADVFYHFMRLTLEPAKLFGFSWYSDSAHPGRISPGFKGHPWFRKKSADVQPMAREPERAEREHAPGELEGYEGKQADEQRAWKRVQDWATEQYRLFRTSDGDIDRITANLAARPEFEGAARDVRAAEIVDRIASVVEDYMSARIEVTTRTTDDPGPDLSAVVADLTGTLRSEQPGDAARLVDDIREALLGMKPDRAAISAEVAVRLNNSVNAFTREQIAQIKHHYMEAVYRRALPIDGSPARMRLDEVADVAEAWLRLIGDEARPEDVLMLQDALAESNFLLANDYASWRDANQYAIRIGFDWDSVRPPLTDWRKGIRYAPAPLPTDRPLPPRPDTDDDGPYPLPPGPSSPPSLPPGQPPGQLPPVPSPDDVATVPLGSPIGADDPTVRLPGPDGAEDP
ncbi:hypothetical protein, partial [Nocardia sp. NPDC050793]|uniref:hypothetical protein n=1 Tax=Nocardia sp. NPDC050793 TaxID=3155159 RepID=UPI0033D59AF1